MYDDIVFGGPCEHCGAKPSAYLLERHVGNSTEQRLCCPDCADLFPEWNRPVAVISAVGTNNLAQRAWFLVSFPFRIAFAFVRNRLP